MLCKKLERTKALATGTFVAGCLAATIATVPRFGAEESPRELAYARVEIDGIGWARLESLHRVPGIEWWVEADDQLLVLAERETLLDIARDHPVIRLDVAPRPERLFFLRGARRSVLAALPVEVLVSGGRVAVVQGLAPGIPDLTQVVLPGDDVSARSHHQGTHHDVSHHVHVALEPFVPDTVLARQVANHPSSKHRIGARSRQLGQGVDGQRWFGDIQTLSAFNRYTHGPDILNARDWIVQQFEALPGLEVTTPQFGVGSTNAFNVVARLDGGGRPDDWYIVGAHYDAISENSNAAAPGAEDNASGCAGAIELARLLTAQPTEGTVFFICYSGEEQGLFGSVDHAAGLVGSGDAAKVRAVLTMDMIGFTEDADLDCLLETSSTWSDLADLFAAAAESTDLRTVISFFPFGSDHVPYLNRGMPALLTIENDWDSYPGYHRSTDLPNQISLSMGVETLKMNAAVIAELAGLSSLIFGDGFESGDTGAWQTGNIPREVFRQNR